MTPEEWVRQHFVHFLVEHKGYPKGLLANEVELKIGRMIIEYKAPTIQLQQKTFDQISIYNLLLKVDYLIVSNGLQHYCCKMDYAAQRYIFLEDIPDYEVLFELAVLRIARLRVVFFSSVTTLSIFTPANSGSIMIRPQYSQTIIFLCILMSS